MKDRLYCGTFKQGDVLLAKRHCLGVEVERLMWSMEEDEFAATLTSVKEQVSGICRLMLHGDALTRDPAVNAAMKDDELLAHYGGSLYVAGELGARRIVFHSQYYPGLISTNASVQDGIRIWKAFLNKLPEDVEIYLENLVDDDPEPMVRLVEAIGDSRFGLCLDIGHAHCNSSVPVAEWVDAFGPYLRHLHLHDNDGERDLHLPLGRGTLGVRQIIERSEQRANHPTYTLECDADASLPLLCGWGMLSL